MGPQLRLPSFARESRVSRSLDRLHLDHILLQVVYHADHRSLVEHPAPANRNPVAEDVTGVVDEDHRTSIALDRFNRGLGVRVRVRVRVRG